MKSLILLFAVFFILGGTQGSSHAQDIPLTAASYYNQGTKDWIAGEKGHAIENYFRALILDPSSRNLQNNFKAIEAILGYPLEDSSLKLIRNLFYVQRLLVPSQVKLITALTWALFWLAILGYIFKRTPFLKKTAWISGFVFLYLLMSLVSSEWIVHYLKRGVVLPDEIILHSNFLENSETAEKISVGMEVIIMDEHTLPDDTQWLLIDRDGITGWVKALEIAKL